MAGVQRIGQYELKDTLGVGSFGKVIRAVHAITGHMVAVKIINRSKVKDKENAEKIKREIQILKLFRHPHIIKLYQVITSPTDIFMVMEYVSGGELFEYIVSHGRLNESEARHFFQQILSGVDYCHRHMIVHRDLKPENLLLDANHNVKIADFGLSNWMRDGDFLNTSCGSPNYAAPEVIANQLYAGPEVDVWSCGVILYVLLCGKLPFDEAHFHTLFKKIKGGVYSMPPHVSAGAREVIQAMICTDPLRRATIASVREIAWFKEDLPQNLFLEESSLIPTSYDEAIISEVCERFQVYRDQVVDSLTVATPGDPLVNAYHLMLENRARHVSDEARELEVCDPRFLRRVPAPSPAAAAAAAATATPAMQFNISLPAPTGSSSSSSSASGKRLRWHLGIRSRNKPDDIMVEVYRTMLLLNFQWKAITPYHARCRVWNQVSGSMTKMSLQLYRVDDTTYLLDFRHLPTRANERLQPLDAAETLPAEGNTDHTLEFFELCALFIAELGK